MTDLINYLHDVFVIKFDGWVVLGFIAVVLATVNAVGGFVVTDRMLEMFKGRSRR